MQLHYTACVRLEGGGAGRRRDIVAVAVTGDTRMTGVGAPAYRCGLTIVHEDQVHDEVARGELVPVLEEFCDPCPGYYLYYQRRHASPALGALIDHLRHVREPASERQLDVAGTPAGRRPRPKAR